MIDMKKVRLMREIAAEFNKEVGAYAISSDLFSGGPLVLQCDASSLDKYMIANNLSYNYMYLGYKAYATGSLILFRDEKE